MKLAPALLVPALLLASPATAENCLRDEASADLAARVFAASRVCPWMIPAPDALVPNLAILFGAVRATDVAEPSCRAIFEDQASAEWEQMQVTSKPDQDVICDEVQSLVKPRRQLKAALMKLNVMKPVPQDPY